MPHLLHLPTELLIPIFSSLDIPDLGSCLLTCRKFKDVIQESRLLQYLVLTALDGVYDGLHPSGPPLLHRIDSLQRWSAAWREPAFCLRSPSRILTRTPEDNVDFLLSDDYLITVDFSGGHGYRHAAHFHWLDLRKPSEDWMKIRFEERQVPLAFTLDTVQNLLAVLLGCTETSTFQLRLLKFHDGSPHPLALQHTLDIALPTRERHYIGLSTHMSMMGPHIVIAAGLPPEITGIDMLLLVDWQKGSVTTLRSISSTGPSTRTYLTDFLVLSDDVLALVRATDNAIELCRVCATQSASLQTIRVLELPPLLPYARLVTAVLKTENNQGTLATHRLSRPPPRYSFGPLATEALVLLTLTAGIYGSVFVDMQTYTLAVHARTLLSYASFSSTLHVSNYRVPWDGWGPLGTRCFDGHSSSSSTVVAGQRWFDRGIIRDFCEGRVRRAAGSLMPRSTLAASRVFACDIESALPYSEASLAEKDDTLVDYALIDGERVVFIVAEPSRGKLNIHVHTMG